MALTVTRPVPGLSLARRLRSSVRGLVLVAGDPPYEAARRIWNGAVATRPAVVVRPADSRDVVTAVRATRDAGLPLSVRGGGHDWGGRALCEGVVIDLSAMRGVTVGPRTGIAEMQGGGTAGDLADAVHPHGFAPVTGTIRAVGMAGLSLAGGYGLLIAQHGLSLDNLLAAQVVLADGTRVATSPAEEPDLFWALRGGGGNFGVVTAARYRVHRPESLLAGLILFPVGAAGPVLRGLRDLLAVAPRQLTVMSGVFAGPDGTPLVFLLPAWVGEAGRGEAWLTRLQGLGTPINVQVGPLAYPQLLGMFDASIVDGRHNEMQTRWLPVLDDASIDLVAAAGAGLTSPYSAVFLHHFRGAAAKVPAGDTAFALRREHVLVEIAAAWPPGEDDRPHRRWARALSTGLAPQALRAATPTCSGPSTPSGHCWRTGGTSAGCWR